VKDCGSDVKKSRVLLVDDEPDIVYLVKTRLQRNGFEVDAYTDPLLALQNFKAGTYLLLVLDIKMPKMDGIELFNRIEKEDNKVKICFFSASEHLTSHYKNLFHNSPDKFLFISKPISIPEMIMQIKQFLSSS
jgi:two-component system, OmpR family, response regulator ChvI